MTLLIYSEIIVCAVAVSVFRDCPVALLHLLLSRAHTHGRQSLGEAHWDCETGTFERLYRIVCRMEVLQFANATHSMGRSTRTNRFQFESITKSIIQRRSFIDHLVDIYCANIIIIIDVHHLINMC